MEIKIFIKDCTNCEDCIAKHFCNNSKFKEIKNNFNNCSICTKRCTDTDLREREWKDYCTQKYCMFEIDSEKARERL